MSGFTPSTTVLAAGCGLAFAPEDPAALADAVRKLAAQPAEADEMGRRGRLAAQQEYSKDVVVAQYVRHLEAVAREQVS